LPKLRASLFLTSPPYVPIYKAIASYASLKRPVPEHKQLGWMIEARRCHRLDRFLLAGDPHMSGSDEARQSDCYSWRLRAVDL